MASLLDLADRMEVLADNVGKQASAKAVDVATALVKALIWRTPVDTSKALSNWQVTLDAPATTEIRPYVPGKRGSTQDASAQAALQNALRVLQEKKPGQVIYVTNNADYIMDLERGSSRQAPAGFLQASLMIARKELKA